MDFFAEEFPKDTPLALISSKRDHIAKPDDIRRLFVVAAESRKVKLCALYAAYVLFHTTEQLTCARHVKNT